MEEKKLRCFLIRVAYRGSGFCGWQRQPEQRSAQQVLEDAVEKIAGEHVFVRGAGRTDSGVHARGQAATLRFVTRISARQLPRALNSWLPEDMAVLSAERVPLGTDAKRHSIGKRYIYRLMAGGPPDPFLTSTHWLLKGQVDLDIMREAAAVLVGQHDYESFRAVGCQSAHARRCVWKIEVERTGRTIAIEFRGNAFCQHMVRILAGTLAQMGQGRIARGSMEEILLARDRVRAGITAPAHGLTMEEVYFPDDGVRAGIPATMAFPGWPPAESSWPPPDEVSQRRGSGLGDTLS